MEIFLLVWMGWCVFALQLITHIHLTFRNGRASTEATIGLVTVLVGMVLLQFFFGELEYTTGWIRSLLLHLRHLRYDYGLLFELPYITLTGVCFPIGGSLILLGFAREGYERDPFHYFRGPFTIHKVVEELNSVFMATEIGEGIIWSFLFAILSVIIFYIGVATI